ncbi:MAG: hypothetical protein Fur0018_02610 [Anaerolineales bacterium]
MIYRHGRPKLAALTFGGMLFGLYEAYNTKVLWMPGWGDASLYLGNLALVETLVLVFWWHPWFSFITPLVLAERLLTGSREIVNALPLRLRRFGVFMTAVGAGWRCWLLGRCFRAPIRRMWGNRCFRRWGAGWCWRCWGCGGGAPRAGRFSRWMPCCPMRGSSALRVLRVRRCPSDREKAGKTTRGASRSEVDQGKETFT